MLRTPPPQRSADSEIGPSVIVRGDILGDGGLILRGRVEGRIEVQGEMLVAPEARVEGSIQTGSLLLEGRVHGDVRAARRLEMGPSSVLLGNFEAPRLRYHRGARMHGRARMLPRAGVSGPENGSPGGEAT